MPVEPPPILSIIPSWSTIQSHLPHTTPIAALITIAIFSLIVLSHIVRLLLRPSQTKPPPPTHYTGDLTPAGVRHGHGTLRLLNGNTYTGGFVDGQFQGQGVYRFRATGTAYDGGWVGGKQEGKGKETYGEGSRYEGGFVAGEREGWGRMEYGNGGVYEGEWKRGKKHGKGRVKESREGEWKEAVWVDGRMRKDKAGGEGGGGRVAEDPNEGKFVLDDELPKDVQMKERKRKEQLKEEEAKTKQGKAS